MTDVTPTPPAESLAAPVPPPAAPQKGKSGKKILATVVGLVVAIVVAVGIRIAAASLFDTTTADDFQVGKCIDQFSTSATAQQTSVPNIVDCSDSSAKAKIIGSYDGKTAADAETYCSSAADAYLELQKSAGGSVLLCLVAN